METHVIQANACHVNGQCPAYTNVGHSLTATEWNRPERCKIGQKCSFGDFSL